MQKSSRHHCPTTMHTYDRQTFLIPPTSVLLGRILASISPIPHPHSQTIPAHHPPKPCAWEGVAEVGSRSRTVEWAAPIAFLKLLPTFNFSQPSTSTTNFNFPTLQAGDGNFATAAYVKDHVPRIAFLETG